MSCALCSLPTPSDPIVENEQPFCCVGCHTVFRILSAQHFTGDFKTHPIFLQALQSGVVRNPELLEELDQKKVTAKEIEKMHFEINNMWCSSCAIAIQWILLKEKGILKCIVDYATDWAIIEYEPRAISKEEIFTKIKSLGYHPASFSTEKKRSSNGLWVRFAVALFSAMNLMMCSYPLYAASFGQTAEGYEKWLGWISFGLALPLVTFCSWPIWRKCEIAFRTGFFGMEILVLIGVSAAFIDSSLNVFQGRMTSLYFDSMAMIIVFVLLGKILEKQAKFSAKEALFFITRTLPKRARRLLPSGLQEYISIKEVQVGDILVAFTGEKIVLDGEVVHGEGLCEEAIMTGESLPVRKSQGTRVIGGSVLKTGSFHYVVKATQEGSFLTRILEMVEKEISTKKSAFRMIDRFIPFVVPLILVAALGTFLASQDLMRSISVLLISCPCALGIAVPLAESLWMQRMAKEGIVVRNRETLSLLAKEALFVFDKTGTVSEGKFSLRKGLEVLSSSEKSVLKTLSAHSTHPMSFAVNEAVEASHVAMEKIHETIGKGMSGFFEGTEYFLGSQSWMKEKGIEVASIIQSASEIVSFLFYARESRIISVLELSDTIRPQAFSVLPQLNAHLLSGDASEVVERIANLCQMQGWKANYSPQNKRDQVEVWKKQGKTVVMVGDGVNDAPAIAAADVGISVASATDLSIQVSDLLLTTNRLEALLLLQPLAKKTVRVIQQNLFWTFFYNFIGISLAICGFLTPFFAAIAMVSSSLCVTFNSMRLKKK